MYRESSLSLISVGSRGLHSIKNVTHSAISIHVLALCYHLSLLENSTQEENGLHSVRRGKTKPSDSFAFDFLVGKLIFGLCGY